MTRDREFQAVTLSDNTFFCLRFRKCVSVLRSVVKSSNQYVLLLTCFPANLDPEISKFIRDMDVDGVRNQQAIFTHRSFLDPA